MVNREAKKKLERAAYMVKVSENAILTAKSDRAKAKAAKAREKWLRRAQMLVSKVGYEYGGGW